MRIALLLLVSFGLFLSPAVATASEDRLHGQWKAVALEFKGKRVDIPKGVPVKFELTFDKKKHTWAMCFALDGEDDCVRGTWSLKGENLTLKSGKTTINAKVVWVGDELKLTMRPPTKRNKTGKQITMYARRVKSK